MHFEQLTNLIAFAANLGSTSVSDRDGLANGPLYDRLGQARSDLRNEAGALFVHRFRDLQKQAIINHEVCGTALQPTYGVIAALLDGGGSTHLLGFEHAALWQAAIRAALDYNEAFPDVYVRDGNYELQNGRMYNVARSLRELRSAGFELTFVDGQLTNMEQLRDIELALATRVQENPTDNLELLFRQLALRYDGMSDRYNFLRSLQNGITPKTRGALPIGFLYLLASTAIAEFAPHGPLAARTDPAAMRVAETWDLYTAYAGVLDVELWNRIETMFGDASVLLRQLRDRVLYEQNFAIRQQTPRQTLRLCELVFAPFAAKAYARILPFTLDDALKVVRVVLERKAGPGALRFKATDVAAACRLPMDRVERVLDALSREAGRVPVADLSFFDLTAGEAMYFPLVRMSGEHYVLIDRLLAGPAVYEAIASAYRPALPSGSFDNIVGKDGLEGAIRTLLEQCGITVLNGRYGDKGLECDAVVETAGSIVFIEAKKKGLTRKSLSGHVESVLFDASQSLLEAQVQLARHEYSLRRDGQLDFHSGYRLRLDGRRVDRVAVTLLDLGSLQDKIVLGNMLTHLRGARLHTDRILDEQGLRAKDAFERTAADLLKYFDLLRGLVPDYERLERFTVRSYALCDFMELLADVTGPDDLAANLAVDRHLTTGIGDWYAEYHLWKSKPSSSA